MKETTCPHPCNSLLPWFLNGTLEQEEERKLRLHLDACPVCARELEELSELIRAGIGEVGEVRFAGERAPLRASSSRSRPLALAAGLAALGIVAVVAWIRWGDFAGSPNLNPQSAGVATLDLGAGTVRGGGSLPEFVPGAGASTIRLSFVAPLDSTAGCEARLESPTGAVIWRGRPIFARPRSLGRATIELSAALLSERGDYSLVVQQPGEGSEARRYSYAFRVGGS